jgi:hypothetical protein
MGNVDIEVARFFECYDDAQEFLELSEKQRRLKDCTSWPITMFHVEVESAKAVKGECF